MINQIIKRDGRLEPFSAEKVNGWGEWASKTLGKRVDWPSVVMKAIAGLPEVCSAEDLQKALIKQCLYMRSWPYYRMAGRLYAATLHKELYGKQGIPTILEVHQRLQAAGYMRELNYTLEEYAQVEKLIKHSRDFKYAQFQLEQIRYKYALRNRVTGEELESPQFVFMRMAMALAEDQPAERRMIDIKCWYDFFSRNVINAPTPNYVNLGTKLNGYASCCLYTTNDTVASLAVGDHIAYTMTYMSAGIGSHIRSRSVGDPVRGGLILHQGKLPYYRALVGAVRANMQNGRAGACNTFYSAFDPEVNDLVRLKNQRTVEDKKIRGMDYTQMGNKFLARKAAKNEQIFLFNTFTAPDLYQAFFSGDENEFASLYEKYEQDPNFKKTYVSARDIVVTAMEESYETGRAYLAFMDEINRHTPYKDTIYSSNLCVEIVEPTEGYENIPDLYTAGPVGYIKFRDTDGIVWRKQAVEKVTFAGDIKPFRKYDAAQNLKPGDQIEMGMSTITVAEVLELKREPEVALCSLGGIVVTNVKSDEEYYQAMYYTLLMIDKCIHMSDYALPHVGYTAKSRLAAAVGMLDVAHYLARKGLKYSTPEGKRAIHELAETHCYFAIEASLQLAKELGNCPWSHRTKWADGWLPIDTYNKNIDKFVDAPLKRNWEGLRFRVVDNGGIRNSALVAHMPTESSSKAAGVANSMYAVREKAMLKTDNGMTLSWAAPDSDLLDYELAWDIPTKDMIECYGVVQKFTDQTISADLYRRIVDDEKIPSTEMINDYIHMQRVGMKTRYYSNTYTGKDIDLVGQDVGCGAGGCTL